ncbi:topoisomerase DNA-binding C4 zinc finger domain-containing protein [Pseudomonas abieticivorans]|uniref:topoisomerase DNA-binding C4 zinc finger domain-containing protein n=1 Tax=Pseudomonas abieticivorans TaxID=2931382 RepID=UPI0020C1650E|nr:topoisomerase DNA-binding C4 zinc finger domain-containing protein [Pseudomonas sp. PIA16]
MAQKTKALKDFIDRIVSVFRRGPKVDQPSEPLAEKPANVSGKRPTIVKPVKAPRTSIKTSLPVKAKVPGCPHCKKPMVIKVARTGSNAGGNFWGCTDYPKCRGIRAIFPGKPNTP